MTLIFSDLKDSTALGERLDSEALHEVKERYFNAMAAEIVRHGGKIEKYIGDAIMAVFGLPRAHEDDALRAVRAAIGMRSVLRGLNESLGARFGVVLANRTGVNTGEVVAIDDPTADQKLATGDAVNVTSRLEQAAPANEIYIGEVTYQLVRDAVEAEPVEPLTLKGKSHPVVAYRLLSVQEGQEGNVRRHDTPVVGRDEELVTLQSSWDAVRTEGKVRLLTVIGDAGIGKSRLVRELMERVASPGRIVCGRCLAYGDGITFWPLREMVFSAAAIRSDDTPDIARDKLLVCTGDAAVADRIASAVGLSPATFPLHEIYWGARRLMQVLAAQGPVLALFDDIHWAEPAFLDLLENMLETIGDSPVLLITTARRDLLEERPQWGERERSDRLVLDAIGDAAATQVVTNLLGEARLPATLMRRIVSAAAGNPLYVEQMLAMLIETGAVVKDGERWASVHAYTTIAVPPTIHALLEARLDNLQRGERATAEPAAVIGMEFPQSAVATLAMPRLRSGIDEQLAALSRKNFIRPMTSADSGLRYRFDHHLVRDTVYNGLLKRARATMHIEFVRWADQANADVDRAREFEEILGYHVEQAYRYLGELGPIDEAGASIGRDGARRLSSAARRALARGDMHAAANLFRRASVLVAIEDPLRAELLPELAEALMGLGEFGEARAVLHEAQAIADRISNARIKASSQLIGMYLGLYSADTAGRNDEALNVAQSLVPLLEREKADNELAIAWRFVALIHGIAGRYQLASEAGERSIQHARVVENGRLIAKIGGVMANTALLGPTPVLRAIEQCEKLIDGGLVDRQVECKVVCILAQLRAMNGEVEVARTLYQRARATLRELGEGMLAASTGIDVAQVELLGGDCARAESELRADHQFLHGKGETYYLSTIAALLSRLIRDQGRDMEALEVSRAAEQATARDDFSSHALWQSIRAPILARAGDLVAAERLARSAVELVQRTETPSLQGDALSELATVLRLAGKLDDARAALSEASALYSAKGNVVSVARSCAQLQALHGRN
ncbi:MAG TPA: AAA family ATPase [Burkholderiaceae bacterium]|nr:AAA family ATPase [Burkholderiaceae bacterium]